MASGKVEARATALALAMAMVAVAVLSVVASVTVPALVTSHAALGV